LEAGASYDRKFRLFYKLLQPWLAKRAMAIATVSDYSARQVSQHFHIPLSRISVLPNGHEHALGWCASRARRATELMNANRRIEPGRFILVIGSRARHKNLSLILQIAPELARQAIQIVIVGQRDGIFAHEDFAPGPNVHFTGPLDDDDLAYMLERALCLAFPSWTEGFGLPIIEAMARGCPVISSDRASMPEVCGDAALFAPPDDPEAWLMQILRLLDSDDLRAELKERGKARLSLFSWRRSAQGYLDLMQALVKDKP
jgi:glycosyltransferase involved in cell wall biosynthesis